MKVLVTVKRVIDPYVRIHVRSDFSQVETQNVKMAMNPFDEIAMEEACRLREQKRVDEIIAVTIGDSSCQETLRQALAFGADKAIHVLSQECLTPLWVAKILKSVVERENPDFILMGKQAIDDDANQTGQMLAALLDWPQATFASKIQIEKDCVVTREIDGGLETIQLEFPCVITTDLRLNEPRYLSLPNIMKAKKKPLTTYSLQDLSINVKLRTKIISVKPPLQRKQGKRVESVSELVQCLHEIEQLI